MTQQGITSVAEEVTDGQRTQYLRLVTEAAVETLADGRLSKKRLQKLFKRGGDLKAGIASVIRDLSVVGRWAKERIASTYTYPEEYRGPCPVAEQVATLRGQFLELKDATYDEAIAGQPIPAGSEGWLAIPRWELLGKTYGEAVDRILAALDSTRKFDNYCERRTGAEYLRQRAEAITAFKKIAKQQQGHGILIVQFQFGLQTRGESVRCAREQMDDNENAAEFGLGAFHVGCMILTHPEREMYWDQLHVDCAGDEFAPKADGSFVYAPRWYFHDGKLKFDARDVADYYAIRGSASGFLPN